MTTSGSQHPLAFFADILFAGLATVACIAVYLVAIAVIKAVLQWWRGGRERFDRVQKLAALDSAMRAPVTRPMDLGGHVIPLFRDPARDCGFCAPRYDGAADCGCAVPCDDPGCGALLWAAVANTEEMER